MLFMNLKMKGAPMQYLWGFKKGFKQIVEEALMSDIAVIPTHSL